MSDLDREAATMRPLMTAPVVCSACLAARVDSVVTPALTSASTAFVPRVFHDAQGREHVHDPNTSTRRYSCDKGHRWAVTTKKPCWCGWGKEAK